MKTGRRVSGLAFLQHEDEVAIHADMVGENMLFEEEASQDSQEFSVDELEGLSEEDMDTEQILALA